jgi:hypothetical protein
MSTGNGTINNCQAATEPAGIRVRWKVHGRSVDDFIYIGNALEMVSEEIVEHVNHLYPDAKVKVVEVLL